MGIADELARLKELHTSGGLSDAEFEAAKAKVLSAEHKPAAPGPAAKPGKVSSVGTKEAVSGLVALIITGLLFWHFCGDSNPKPNAGSPPPSAPPAPLARTLQQKISDKIAERAAVEAAQISQASTSLGIRPELIGALKYVADKAYVPFDVLTTGLRSLVAILKRAHNDKATAAVLKRLDITLKGYVSRSEPVVVDGKKVSEVRTTEIEHLVLKSFSQVMKIDDQDRLAATAKTLFGQAGDKMLPMIGGMPRDDFFTFFDQALDVKADFLGLLSRRAGKVIAKRIADGMVKVKIEGNTVAFEVWFPPSPAGFPTLLEANGATTMLVELAVKVLMELAINVKVDAVSVTAWAQQKAGKGLTGEELTRVFGHAFYDEPSDGVKFKPEKSE